MSITTSSDLKSETSRINGAKSNGPITPEGKSRSSANSRKHGLTSASILIPGESADDLRLLAADYMDRFQPQDGVEADLVEVMIAARWRLRRLLVIEAHQLEVECLRHRKVLDADFYNLEPEDHLAHAFQKLSNNGLSLTLILRYETTINRSYNKALEQLQKLQANRPPVPVGSFGNPPEPAPETEPRPSEAVPPQPPPAIHPPAAMISPDPLPVETPSVSDFRRIY